MEKKLDKLFPIFSLWDNDFETLKAKMSFKNFNLMTVTSNICEAYLINDYVIFFINLYLNVGTPNALFI